MSLAPLDGPLVTEIHPNKAEALMHSSIEARLRASTGGAINIFRYAAFTILEGRDDQLFLATRNTAPHTGIYSAIGGKCDPVKGRDIRYPTNQPWDMLVRGWERLAQTARREAIEEAFCNQKNEYNLQVHGYEPEDDAVLEAVWPLAAFQRLAVVYDNIFNVYCVRFVQPKQFLQLWQSNKNAESEQFEQSCEYFKL